MGREAYGLASIRRGLPASQAATASADARTCRAERRARADLEARVETSPVGAAVFDVAAGRLVSSNREQALGNADTVRAGPVELSVADGGRVATLDQQIDR